MGRSGSLVLGLPVVSYVVIIIVVAGAVVIFLGGIIVILMCGGSNGLLAGLKESAERVDLLIYAETCSTSLPRGMETTCLCHCIWLLGK